MLVRIDDLCVGPPISLRQIELRSDQPFIEEPDAPRVGARGRGPDKSGDGGRAGRGKQSLEDGQVEPLVFQGEGQVSFQARFRRVARRIDAPAAVLQEPVPRTGGA